MKTLFRHWQYALPLIALLFAIAGGNSYASETAGTPIPPIPFKRESVAEEIDVSRIAMGTGVAILALAVSLYLLRRRLGTHAEGTSAAKQLRVLETRRLTPRSTLFVIEFAGSRYLVAESGQNIKCLGTAPLQTDSNAERT